MRVSAAGAAAVAGSRPLARVSGACRISDAVRGGGGRSHLFHGADSPPEARRPLECVGAKSIAATAEVAQHRFLGHRVLGRHRRALALLTLGGCLRRRRRGRGGVRIA
eukprot:5502175-Prymnesium_polylepis.1